MLLCAQWSNKKEARGKSIFSFFCCSFLSAPIFTLFEMAEEEKNRKSAFLFVLSKI